MSMEKKIEEQHTVINLGSLGMWSGGKMEGMRKLWLRDDIVTGPAGNGIET